MYTIEEFLENYQETELGAGAELALSIPVVLQTSREWLGADSVVRITADIREETGNSPETAKVTLDEAHGELVDAHCTCGDYEQDSFCCKHIVALQTAWLEKTLGRDALAASPLKEILVKRTGLPNPFASGILRKTSKEITGLLKKTRDLSVIPKGTGGNAAPGSLRIEVIVNNVKEKLFELRTGVKHAYVVKDVREFLTAFDSGRELQFGSSLRFAARKEFFDEPGQKALSVLLGIVKEARDDRRKQIYFSVMGALPRYIRIAGHDFDRLMEECGGNGLYLSDGKKLFFSAEERLPEFTLVKQEFGALLSPGSDRLFTRTAEWLYILRDRTIYRISREGHERAEEILELTDSEAEFFISEKDLPAVCTNVIAGLEEEASVSCTGMELGGYLPPKPTIRLYLDHPQPDMISCRPVAHYEKKEYPLAAEIRRNQKRDFRAEKEAALRIRPLFSAYEEASESFFCQGGESELYEFLTVKLPLLSKVGEIYISDKLKKLRVRPVTQVSVGVSMESGLLNLDVQAGDFSREELYEILSSYQPKKKFYRLRDGSFVPVQKDQEALWQALSDCFKGLRKPGKQEWKLPLFRAMYLEEMLRKRDGVSYNSDREYRRLIGRMQNAENSTAEPPASLAGTLRGYQADGFRWLRMLKDNGFGGILADDMGLGKTLQVQAFLLSEWEAGKRGDAMRTLIVTPASLLYNWQHELAHFTPELPVRVIAGAAKEREELIRESSGDDGIWLTSYDLLKRDIQWYETVTFANEILDEAQYIKNQTTHAAKSVRLVQSGFRLALTGTPIENRLSELWSIFDYLMPGFLFPYARFREEIEVPAVASGDSHAMEKLRMLVHPFILRRLKKEVLKELPDKLEEEVSVQLQGEQKNLYAAHAQRLRMFLAKQSQEEFAHGKLEILSELTKLRQLCCDPALLVEDYKGGSAKLDACMELIHRAMDGGHKILLFSQFTSMLDIIGEKLRGDGIAYYRIDGSVEKGERIRLVDAFNQDEVPVFCISLKAGGTGLNLTAADIVIHYDPWWNLAAQNQATDRTHRIGQTHVVTVYQLIAADTVEERITALQKSKYQLAADVLSGEGISSIMIDKEQVLSLLGAI